MQQRHMRIVVPPKDTVHRLPVVWSRAGTMSAGRGMGLLPRVGRRRCTPADVPGDPVGHKAVDKCGDEGGVIDSIRAAEPDVVPHLISVLKNSKW